MSTSVLSFAIDGILSETGAHFSGAFQRQLDYGQSLVSYHVVTDTKPGRTGPVPPVRVGNTYFYPTNTIRMRRYIPAAIRIGERVIRDFEIGCITCADPTYTALAGIYLSRKYRIPLDISLMSDMVGNPHYLTERPVINRLQMLLARFSLHCADRIRVSTEFERIRLQSSYAKRVYVARFYVDPSASLDVPAADTSALRQNLLGNDGDAVVLFVGRLAPQKNIEVLLHAFCRVLARRSGARLVIVGAGPEAKLLESLAVQLGIASAVRFVGAIPFKDVPLYFQASDVFAITSRHEGTCMVLLEAALARRPIVATRFAGAVDLLESIDESSLADIGNDTAVADKILALLDDPERRNRVGEKLRARVLADFAPEKIAAERAGVWIQLARQRVHFS